MPEALAIGVDTYCYHRFLGELRAVEAPPPERFDHEDLLAEIVSVGAEVASFETCYLPRHDEGFLAELRAELAAGGAALALSWGHPSGLAGGADPIADAELAQLVVAAGQIGVDLVRIVVGGPQQWQREPETDMVQRLVPFLEHHLDRADAAGVRLGVETHCELSLPSFVRLVERFEGRLGVVLDTGNVVRIGARLDDAVAALGSSTVMVHAKDLSLRGLAEHPHPADPWWCTPVGHGRLEILDALDQLVAEGFAGPVCVEIMELDPDIEGDERDAVRQSLDAMRAWRSRTSPRPDGCPAPPDVDAATC